ncbi:serine/threonine protein kinase [Mycobacterium lacus]|uniref:non-specific serine/threonine protein kinase n=1 Tax=Mycobacterium lacus TaxID=169765 RepID=A0A1X1Y5A8_9MYCO|nr:serine/threonine-protein kinase [Mycobacterium lacus]MCV7125071.1 protein kinase [Mycobacterium lacus]ORW06191.1 serine/threonine protein kinase [Mycobacterium lacus]BBX97553.1 serine/threonine-protein kinase PknI [Mycobacterium lacus]
MALATGTSFAGYTVVRRLGSGRTGDVYLVQRTDSPGWQALKVLPLAMSADDEFRRRFHQETPIVANLYHPHIVEVHDRGEFDGQLWVAMDYVNGVNGEQLMADRFPAVLPAGEVLAIITATAAALDYAHQRGLLHRDVKPANILLTGPGDGEQRILLTDFGIARRPDGAVAYAAPEQLMGAAVDGRADQYALAATAFHLLTSARPVERSGPPRLSDQRPELARLDGLFARALAKRPADRFGSCREFAEAVNRQAGVGGGDRSPEAVFVVDYPAYEWPGADDAGDTESAPEPLLHAPGTSKRRGTILQSAASALARRLDSFSTPAKVPTKASSAVGAGPPSSPPKRRAPRSILFASAAAVLLVGLVALGVVIGRETDRASTRAANPTTSAPPAAGTPTTSAPVAAPVPLDGTYRIEVERSKQTFDYTPNPQPPDVSTWWAFRSSCTPTTCVATGTLLDDNDHTRAKPDGGRPIILDFTDGRWQSRPETVVFPCVGPNGEAKTQTTLQALSLRLQPQHELVGEMTVTVQTNECGQQGAVVRIPAVATRSGDVPPAVNVPDPGTMTPAPTSPTTTASGPGR